MRKQIESGEARVGIGIEEEDEASEASNDGGDEVTITLAAEKFAPVQYHSFDVGPFVVKTTRMVGETLKDVYRRVMPTLRAMQEEEFRQRLPEHLSRVRTAGSAARGAGR